MALEPVGGGVAGLTTGAIASSKGIIFTVLGGGKGFVCGRVTLMLF